MVNLSELPSNLPIPKDDGAAKHLEGLYLPGIQLNSTDGSLINIGNLAGKWVLYFYPMTGQPNVPLPDGWDAIPGARGCTPQSCSFRDYFAELKLLNTNIVGISSQTTEYQLEAKLRLHLPFELLSDSQLQLKHALNLPVFNIETLELYQRLTMIVDNNRIVKVFYPVFPPDKNAEVVIEWLKNHQELA
ncbi:MAG: peroxiredoxin [Methylotenera sp.]|nr:peroxiredoxin [Methylotenera sp.]